MQHPHDRGEARLELQRAHVSTSRASRSSTRPARTGSTSSSSRSRGASSRWPTSTCPPTPTGPTRRATAATRDEVLQLENDLRVPAVQTEVHEPPQLAAQGIPVFLTGDFNSPSHLDWTPAVDAVRDDVPYPVVWPVVESACRRGVRGLVPLGLSEPGCPPRLHVDARFARGREGRGARPHRLGPLDGAGDGDREQRGRRGREPERRHRRRPVALGSPRRRLHLRRHARPHADSGRGGVAEPGAGRRRCASASMPRVSREKRVALAPGRRGTRRHEVDGRRRRRDAFVSDRRPSSGRIPGQAHRSGRRGGLPVAVLALPAWRDDDGLDEQVALQGRRAHPRLVEEGSRDEVGLARRLQGR